VHRQDLDGVAGTLDLGGADEHTRERPPGQVGDVEASLERFTLAAVAALGLVASADARKRARYPEVSKIAPLKLGLGEELTITGRNFVAGKLKNTVVFKRDGERAIFVKAATATRTKLTVVVPEKLKAYMGRSTSGTAVPTRFRIRVLARRFAKAYSPLKASPVIAPVSVRDVEPAPAPTLAAVAPATVLPPPDCDKDGAADDVDTDDDNDLLTDVFEAAIKTDPCAADTDGDGMWDVWEYTSALDLNSQALPYPGKRPYPNPLFADADVDYDGDGMTAAQEHAMWQAYGNRSTTLNYSDGTQTSDVASGLTDDRRDVDADGIPNWWEANGPGQREWWSTVYDQEKPYAVVYGSLDYLDPDVDGDGRLDGADDIDHDGWTNADEMSRTTPFAGTDGMQPRWVQPFNPCLPDPEAATCSLHPPTPLSNSWPPFKQLGFPVSAPERPLNASNAP